MRHLVVIAALAVSLIGASSAQAHVIDWGCCWHTWVGHPHSDVVRGTNVGDNFRGRRGNDWIAGRGGNDWLDGGGGADFLNGGRGIDTCVVTRRDHVHSCEHVGGITARGWHWRR